MQSTSRAQPKRQNLTMTVVEPLGKAGWKFMPMGGHDDEDRIIPCSIQAWCHTREAHFPRAVGARLSSQDRIRKKEVQLTTGRQDGTCCGWTRQRPNAHSRDLATVESIAAFKHVIIRGKPTILGVWRHVCTASISPFRDRIRKKEVQLTTGRQDGTCCGWTRQRPNARSRDLATVESIAAFKH